MNHDGLEFDDATLDRARRSASTAGLWLTIAGAIGAAYILTALFTQSLQQEMFVAWFEQMGLPSDDLKRQFENPTMAEKVMQWGSTGLGLVAQALVIFGGLRMRACRTWSLALTGAIVAAIPCFGCCCVGMPIGIWAIIVLAKPEVKAAFAANDTPAV